MLSNGRDGEEVNREHICVWPIIVIWFLYISLGYPSICWRNTEEMPVEFPPCQMKWDAEVWGSGNLSGFWRNGSMWDIGGDDSDVMGDKPCFAVRAWAGETWPSDWQCVLLGPKCALKKFVCSATPLLLMNPMHHPGHESKKTCFFTQRPWRVPSLGCANLGSIKALGTSQLVPIRSPGTRSC